MVKNPDIVVIGAGAAGLAAGHKLHNAGKNVLVVEAGPAIGGRCITDNQTFNVPFDRGGSWLHSTDVNPLVGLAERSGFELSQTRWEYGQAVLGGKELSAEQLSQYDDYQEKMWGALRKAGDEEPDRSAASVLTESIWKEPAQNWIAQYMAVDAEKTSCRDLFKFDESGSDWLVKKGLGSLIETLADGLPLQLDCAVTLIDYSNKKIQLESTKGTIHCDKVIVTVSTGALNSGSIRFLPELPDEKSQAIEKLPMGLLNKIGILFKPGYPGVEDGFLLDYQTSAKEFFCCLFRFSGSDLAVAFVAGSFAMELEKGGSGYATQFCIEGLREALGNDVTNHIVKTDETSWMSNSLTLGAYSAALPGYSNMREILATPIQNRLFFAGEATIPTACATVHGAYMSGLREAEAIIDGKS